MKKISTLAIAMFALFTSQSIQAKNNQTIEVAQTAVFDNDEIEARYAKKEADPDFKFEEAEITIDLAEEGPYVLPKLLNPNKLDIESYGTSDSQLIYVDEDGNFELVALQPGDVTMYAKGKRNAKFADSEAECLVHIVNTNIISAINFGNDEWINREGDGGWKDSNGYWQLTQSSWWIAGEFAWNIVGHTEAYLVSPEFELTTDNNGYQIEFIHSCYYKDVAADKCKFMVHEVGGDWIEMEGIQFPEPTSYATVSSGCLKVPAEFLGKTVEFAFLNIAEGNSNDANWNVQRFAFMKDNSVPTGIENVNNKPIVKDNKIYDLQGRQVKNPNKGIYIVNGKKVIF